MALERIDGYSDSDYAGGYNRTSTTGGLIFIGGTVVKSWSKQQRVVALSSGEAELYAAVKLGCEMLGIKSLAADFGIKVQLHMYIDAKATFGMLMRRGAGGMKHIETCNFWLQQKMYEKIIFLHRINSEDNPADILTKYLSGDKMNIFRKLLGYTMIERAVIHR